MLNVMPLLLKLQEFDRKIRQIRKKIQRKQEEIDHLISEQAVDEKKLSELKTARDRKTLDLSRKELELKEIDEKLITLKEKLYSGDIHSSKELSQWEKNMEVFEKTRNRLEEDIISRMIAVEETQNTFRQEEARFDQRNGSRKTCLAQTRNDLTTLTEELTDLNQERETITGEIPESYLHQYAELTRRVNDPVAELVDDTCQGCRLSVPLSSEITIRRSDSVSRCPNCQRFIYSKQG